MQKPEKIYLENPNLNYTLSAHLPSIGTVRETFFQNQVGRMSAISIPKKGDFILENGTTIEVGGPNKTGKQIAGMKNAYLALDGISRGGEREIPLYLFGLLS